MGLSKIIKILLQTKADTKAIDTVDGKTKKHSKTVAALKATYAGFSKVAKSAWSAAGSAITGARNIAIGATAAIGGTVKEFYDWNKEAARAWTMMKAGQDEFYGLRTEIAKLSPELGKSKAELGAGWYEALSKGVDKNKLVDFLRVAGQVAVADSSTVVSSVNGIMSVLNAYNIDASEADKVSDKMFQTIGDGSITFEQMASYIATAATTTSTMGISIDQLLGAVSAMTKKGITVSTAFNQIKNSALLLSDELGDGWSKSMTFAEALDEVGNKAGYSETALQKIFGTENIAGVFALIGENAEKAAVAVDNVSKAEGFRMEAYKKVSGEIGHWTQSFQTIWAVLSDIGQAFDSALRQPVKQLKESLENWRINTDSFDKLEEKLVMAVGMAQDIWFAVSGGGKGNDLMSGIGQTLRGVAEAAGQAVISLLLKAAPIIGAAIGAAAKAAIFGSAQDTVDKNQALTNLKKSNPESFGTMQTTNTWLMSDGKKQQFEEELKRVQMQRFQREGAGTAAQYMKMFGNSDIAGGMQKISDVAQAGRDTYGPRIDKVAEAGNEAAAALSELTPLLDSVFGKIVAEVGQIKQKLSDVESRSKQVGG